MHVLIKMFFSSKILYMYIKYFYFVLRSFFNKVWRAASVRSKNFILALQRSKRLGRILSQRLIMPGSDS